jgi:hypothetical protein
MTKQLKPPAYDWKAREIKDWNATTFRAYLRDRHRERFGIEYTPNSVKMEAGMLARMNKEYGPEILKAFIDLCLREYRPAPGWPGVNFCFMYSKMKSWALPRVLDAHRREQERQEAKERARLEYRTGGEGVDIEDLL